MKMFTIAILVLSFTSAVAFPGSDIAKKAASTTATTATTTATTKVEEVKAEATTAVEAKKEEVVAHGKKHFNKMGTEAKKAIENKTK